MTDLPLPTDIAAPAPLKRRLACMLYEMLLLLGVLALGFIVPHLLVGTFGGAVAPGWFLNLHIFVLIGAYFVWYWTHNGQTLAMQTWKIRLVRDNGAPLGTGRAVWRYLLSCLWLVPAIVLDAVLHPSGSQHLAVFFFVGIGFAPLSALLDPQRLFLHDRLARTRLVQA